MNALFLPQPRRGVSGLLAACAVVTLIAAGAAGCSSAGDTSLNPEGEIGAGSLDGTGDGNGSTPGDSPLPGDDAAVCGDETCDPGENVFSCRVDCEAGPFLQCLTEACPELVQGCSESDACASALICLSACDPEADFEAADACRTSCAADLAEADAAAFGLITACELDSECRPDGPPEEEAPDETDPGSETETDPALSCEGRCGEPIQDGAPCACDASCAILETAATTTRPYEDAPDPGEDGCGDGICGASEDADTCATDCAETPVDPCGDGVCAADESPESCPADCEGESPGPEGVVACLADACPAEYESCVADEACLEVLDCISSCPPGAQDCLFECSQLGGFSMTAINLGLCGQESGCFNAEPPPGAFCGDGLCQPAQGENEESCPEDCESTGGTGNGWVTDPCALDACGSFVDNCSNTPGCVEAFECINACQSQGCVNECISAAGEAAFLALDELYLCYGENCEGGGPPGEDCVYDECGAELNSCFDDPDCEFLLICIQDCQSDQCVQQCAQQAGNDAIGLYNELADCYVANCQDTGSFCGDGSCDPGENPDNCPEDCQQQPPPGGGVEACLEDNCPGELQECYGDPDCVAALECIGDCPPGDQGCLFDCSQVAGFSGAAINVGLCGQSAGCFEGGPTGPVCGNGLCEDGESEFSCPEDCDTTVPPPGGGVEACLEENCPAELEACLDDAACVAALDCIGECPPGDQGCLFGCAQAAGFSGAAIDAGLCGQGAGCFDGDDPPGPVCGDGVCQDGESAFSCPEDCSNGPTECAPGCPDFWIGDDICDPQCDVPACEFDGGDCDGPGTGGDEAIQCIVEECNVGNQCQNSNSCFGAIECIAGCESEECVFECAANMQGGGKNYITNQVAPCAVDSGCLDFGGGPVDPPPAEGFAECLSESCETQLNTCYTNGSQTCPATFDCVFECIEAGQESAGGCLDSCWSDNQGWTSGTTTDLYECSLTSGCADGGVEPGPICGDGICEPGEDCDADCEGTEPLFGCLSEACPTQWGNCLDDDVCAAALPCLNECVEGGGTGCTYQCMPPQENDLLLELGTCGGQNGCGNICGDGECDPGEDFNSCPQDCEEPQEALFGCLSDACPAQWEDCLDDPVCSDALPCLNECVEGGGTGCTYQCMPPEGNDVMLELGVCGFDNGCGNTCGNGQCDPGESADSCPEDCADGEPVDPNEGYFECVEEACSQQLFSCYNNGSQTCPATFDCVDECLASGKEVNECVNGCYELNNGQTSNTTTTLYQCSANTCHDPDGDGGGGDGAPGGGGDQGGTDDPTEEILQCLESECSSELDACYDSDTCPEVLECAIDCGGDFNCAFQCASDSLFDPAVMGIGFCLQDSGCLAEAGGG